jgi:aspartyl-tRNA(Asn)/glutamyl-tRNA(Gln) amidotransferase subunit B
MSATTTLTINPLTKTIANIITGNLLAHASRLNKDVYSLLPKQSIVELARFFDENKINNQGIGKAIEILIDSPDQEVLQVLEQNNLLQVTDTNALSGIVDEVINTNPNQVTQYKEGKVQLIGFLVGQCMKKSGGQGNPKIFNELLAQKLA